MNSKIKRLTIAALFCRARVRRNNDNQKYRHLLRAI